METLPLRMMGSANLKSCEVHRCQVHPKHGALDRKKTQYRRQGEIVKIKKTFVDCAYLVQKLRGKEMTHLIEEVLLGMKTEGSLPEISTLPALMLCYADNGLFPQAQAIWEMLLNSSFVLTINIISELMDAYGRMGQYNEVIKILDQLSSRNFSLLPQAYSAAISCFGNLGQLELMENTLKEMVSRGLPVDSTMGNALIKHYSTFGSLTQMETACGFLKSSRHLIDKEGIKAVSFAYVKEKKFYRLGTFLKNVGLGRKDVGNLLWNYLLLSYAANFKMKSLQREFMNMLEAGFRPDLTTFNIRAVAFSKMALFWDLHLSLEHMKHENVVPDLVTYGCVVDAYLDKRLGRNLDFAFCKMNVDDSPQVSTDPLTFEAFGKGDFHSSVEAFMEFSRQRKWTYRKLIAVYLKKQFRRNQIFWNY